MPRDGSGLSAQSWHAAAPFRLRLCSKRHHRADADRSYPGVMALPGSGYWRKTVSGAVAPALQPPRTLANYSRPSGFGNRREQDAGEQRKSGFTGRGQSYS